MFSGISQWSQISAAKPSVQKMEEYIYCKWTWDCLGRQHMLYNLSHISTCFQSSLLSKCCGSLEPSVKWMAGETLRSETRDTSITLGVLVGSKILSLDCKEVLCKCFSLPAISDGPQARTCSQALSWPADMTQAFQNMHSFPERLSQQMWPYHVHQFLSIKKGTPQPQQVHPLHFLSRAYCTFQILQVQINPQN